MQTVNIGIINLDTYKERCKKLNVFESKMYRRILDPEYGNEKDNWRILTDKEIYAIIKIPAVTVETHMTPSGIETVLT
jgi:hypothetical protein